MRAPSQAGWAVRGSLLRRLRFGSIRSYSRFVQRAKLILPGVAVLLLLLIGVWPRLAAVVERVNFQLPRLDLTEARQLRMVDPRYAGIDRQNRPFVLTAEAAKQAPKADDLVTLDGPKGDLTTLNSNWLEVTADAGTYLPTPQLLDLFGNVELYQDRGNEFHTDSAHLDLLNGTGEGHDPVDGHGPFGHVNAEGFKMYDRGDVIIFTGKSKLDLLPRPKAAS
jgi:lipopolysaccharide export system protein LptC